MRTFEDIDVDVASSLGASVHGGVAEVVLLVEVVLLASKS